LAPYNPNKAKKSVSDAELVPWMLSNFATVDEVLKHLKKIDINDVKEGDYICIDGESSFCHTSYLKIFSVVEQVTMEDGKIVPFLILIDEDGDSWSSLDGSCVNNPNSMYGVVGYYRYDETYSRMAEIEKLPDENSYFIDVADYLAKHLSKIMGE
jgi:hypothetical protein